MGGLDKEWRMAVGKRAGEQTMKRHLRGWLERSRGFRWDLGVGLNWLGGEGDFKRRIYRNGTGLDASVYSSASVHSLLVVICGES